MLSLSAEGHAAPVLKHIELICGPGLCPSTVTSVILGTCQQEYPGMDVLCTFIPAHSPALLCTPAHTILYIHPCAQTSAHTHTCSHPSTHSPMYTPLYITRLHTHHNPYLFPYTTAQIPLHTQSCIYPVFTQSLHLPLHRHPCILHCYTYTPVHTPLHSPLLSDTLTVSVSTLPL